MTLTAALGAWLALNYLIMVRLAYVALRRDGASPAAAAGRSLFWPALLLLPARTTG